MGESNYFCDWLNTVQSVFWQKYVQRVMGTQMFCEKQWNHSDGLADNKGSRTAPELHQRRRENEHMKSRHRRIWRQLRAVITELISFTKQDRVAGHSVNLVFHLTKSVSCP